MSEPKDHHYIPIFYLSRWGRAGDGRVAVFSRRNGKVVHSWLRPRSTGYETDLNSLEGVAPENKQIIEKIFMSEVIDGQSAPALEFLVENRGRGLTPDHVIRIVYLLLSLRVRHPDGIAKVRRDGERILWLELERSPDEYEALRTSNDPPTLAEFVKKHDSVFFKNFGLLQLPNLITNPDFVSRVGGMIWRVIDCQRAGIDLVTADRPVYLEGSILSGPCLIVFPASPTLLLIISTHKELIDAVTAGTQRELVKRVNRSLTNQAVERVYATGEHQLPLVEKRLRF